MLRWCLKFERKLFSNKNMNFRNCHICPSQSLKMEKIFFFQRLKLPKGEKQFLQDVFPSELEEIRKRRRNLHLPEGD